MHTCEYAGLEKRFAFIGQLRVRNQAKKAVMEVNKKINAQTYSI